MALAGQVTVYAVLVVSYAILFQGIDPAMLARLHLTRAQLGWYLAATQGVIACSYYYYRELEITIRSGDIECLLMRPQEFWPMLMAEWFGQYVARMVILLPVGFTVVFLVNGEAPPLSAFPAIVLCILLGGLLFICVHLLVGCTAIWVNPIEPVFRFWQKLIFFVGARTSPLILYPAWMAALAWLTPGPAVLAVAGNASLGLPPRIMALQLLLQGVWLGLGLVAVSRAVRRVRLHVGRGG